MRPRLLVIPAALTLAAATPPRPPPSLAPYKSCLDNGHGLRACTWRYIDPAFTTPGHITQDDVLPWRLVMYRNGRPIYRKPGAPFIWQFGFLDDGKTFIYESGPLHFGMLCTLIVAASGRQIASQPCYTDDDMATGQAWARRWFASGGETQAKITTHPLDPSELRSIPKPANIKKQKTKRLGGMKPFPPDPPA